MAANSDGSIILETKIDESGITKGLGSITLSLKKVGAALGVAFGAREIIRFSNEASKAASTVEASVERIVEIYGAASESVVEFINTTARSIGMSKSAAMSYASVYGNLFSVWADQNTNAELTNQYLNMTAVVASKTGRSVSDVQERIRSGLLGNTEAIEDLGVFVNVKTIEMTNAFRRMANGRSWDKLSAYEQNRVRTLAILEQATQKYGNTVANTSVFARSSFTSAWEDFKATWGMVVNGVLIPVLNVLTKIISVVTLGLSYIAKFMGKSTELGKTTASISTSAGTAADNIDNATESQKKYNKEVKKTLAGFDELEILQNNTDDGAGRDAGINAGGAGTTLETPEVSGEVGGYEPDVSSWQSAILGLVEILAGTGLVALGIILCTMGHLPLGVGAITAGLFSVGVGLATLGEAFNASGAKEMLLIVTGITGLLLLSIGVLLCFFGSLPCGVACIVGGVAMLGYTAFELAKGGMETEQIMSTLSALLAFLGGALLAIGVFLCFMTVYPMGIACILAGLAALVGSGVAAVKSDDKEVKNWLELLLTAISGFLIVLGVILCIFGVLPLGIGLIAVGAAVLVVTLINKNDTLPADIKNWINRIFTIVSAATLVLGIILLFTGAGIPLAIGLIALGAVGLAAETAVNWNFIVDKVKGIWEKVKQFWNDHIKKIFTKEWWVERFESISSGFKSVINSIRSIFAKVVNWIVEKLNALSFDVPDWVPKIGGKKFGFNLKKIEVPALAQGAVIPANREFLAVLGDQKRGTNIEAPAELIKQMAKEAYLEMGLANNQRQVIKEEHYNLNQTELMTIMYKLVKGGERLNGTSLIKQGGI